MILETGFLWILLFGVIFGVLHSFFASYSAKNWVANQFNISNPRLYRFVYILQSFFFTLVFLGLVFIFPDRTLYLIPVPWIYLNLVIELALVICIYLSLRQTGIQSFLGLDLPEVGANSEDHPGKLMTVGFYRYVRHPLYLFSLLFIWLLPFMTCNLLAWNIAVTVYIMVGSNYEERKMVREFGQEYLDYQKWVPAFFPHLKQK